MKIVKFLSKISLCIVVTQLALFSPCFADNRDLIIAIDESYPPYMYGNVKEPKGLYPRIIKIVFKNIGTKVGIAAYPWKRALSLGEQGKAGIGGLYMNNERIKKYDYSEPIFTEKLMVYVLRNNSFKFRKITDLRGKKVGINKGWSYGEEFDSLRKQKVFDIEEVKDNITNFKMLEIKRVDCIVVDEVSAAKIIAKNGLRSKVESLKVPLTINKAYIAFAKKSSKQTLLNNFNNYLKKMRADGSYDKIISDFMKEWR